MGGRLKILDPIRMPLRRAYFRVHQFLRDLAPDRSVIAVQFKKRFGRPLNLRHPTIFSEKIQWLKRYYRIPLIQKLADKHAVREYVADLIGLEALTQLYGVWDRPRDIDFDSLPNQFALKITSGSGMNIFCRDKSQLDKNETIQQLNRWRSRSTYWRYREWHYKRMKPRIICEQLLDDEGKVPLDFKFNCFNGEPRFIQVDVDRFGEHKRGVFDLNWQLMPFRIKHPPSAGMLPRPANLEEMIDFARKLSRGFPFVRVDLYSVKGRTMFGEITFYPEGGLSYFVPDSYDMYWGEQIQLPDLKGRIGLPEPQHEMV